MSTHVVSRPFYGAGAVRETGEVVDTSEWPASRAGQLVRSRYLRPLAYGENPVACDCGCGKTFVDDAACLDHMEAATALVGVVSEPPAQQRTGRRRRQSED